MTISTTLSSALLQAANQSFDNSQRNSARQPDTVLSTEQDTVTLSGQIIGRLSGEGSSEERIAALKQQYENGTYQPSSQDLAGRILDIHL